MRATTRAQREVVLLSALDAEHAALTREWEQLRQDRIRAPNLSEWSGPKRWGQIPVMLDAIESLQRQYRPERPEVDE